MCGSLQMKSGEKMKTEQALRKELGAGSKDWAYAYFIRSEGVYADFSKGLDEDGLPGMSWGATPEKEKWEKKRWKIYDFIEAEIEGFQEKGASGRQLWFPRQGKILIPVFHHWRPEYRGKTCFGIVTGQDKQVAAICKKDRGPLVLPVKTKLTTWLKQHDLAKVA